MEGRGEEALLSILILSWNTRELTLRCLEALERDPFEGGREILLLDNGSGDGSADAVEARFPEVRLRRSSTNLGYAVGNNRLADEARGEILCLLNSDTEVRPGALLTCVDFLRRHPEYAGCAPRLVSPDGSVQRSCKRFPGLSTVLTYDMFWAGWPLIRRIEDRYFMRDFDHLHDRDVLQPPGACFLVRREVWERLGGLDPELWLYYNDVDFCLRLHQEGGRIRYLAGPEVLHHEGASTRVFASMLETWARNRIAFHRKHHGAFGERLVRFMLRLRAWQEWWRIGRRHRDRRSRRDARAELRRILHEVLAG